MKYSSTRADTTTISFDEAVLAGLAADGGLYLPESLPQFSATELKQMAGLSYPELAIRIMLPFMGDGWDEARLRPLVERSYCTTQTKDTRVEVSRPSEPSARAASEPPHGRAAGETGGKINFRHRDTAPLVKLNEHHHILELFHGPTLAFKDFALQFLGNLLGDILARNKQKVTVVGATSGDTGSAAIAGLAGQDAINIHILYPDGRVSDVQRRQMTTVTAPNVFALAIDGNFDDCQALVKAMFNDRAFNKQHNLVAVNSINWARIMAQIVYYFYAALKLGSPDKKISFSVPTGNFGDIYAGWLAKHMGLPINKLIIASNSNDILTRCWSAGKYEMTPVVQTLSPSMDIQISSNFERLLFNYVDRDGQAIEDLMQTLKAENVFELPDAVKTKLADEFFAHSVDDELTKQTIKRIDETHNMLIDPHTATGVVASEKYLEAHPNDMVVTLATAHPAKFPDAVEAATGKHPELPEHMKDLFEKEERFHKLPAELEATEKFISQRS